jgi:hypothetical protein
VLDHPIERLLINTATAMFCARIAEHVGPNERTNPTIVV